MGECDPACGHHLEENSALGQLQPDCWKPASSILINLWQKDNKLGWAWILIQANDIQLWLLLVIWWDFSKSWPWILYPEFLCQWFRDKAQVSMSLTPPPQMFLKGIEGREPLILGWMNSVSPGKLHDISSPLLHQLHPQCMNKPPLFHWMVGEKVLSWATWKSLRDDLVQPPYMRGDDSETQKEWANYPRSLKGYLTHSP